MRPMSHSPFSHFLGGGNSNIFYFHPYLGKIPILTNIFRRSWNTNQLCVGRNFICCENNSKDKTGQSLKLSPHFLWHQTQILCWKLPLQPCYLKWRRLSKRGWDILQLPVPTFETVTSRVANLWEIPLQPNSPFKFGGGFEVLNL